MNEVLLPVVSAPRGHCSYCGRVLLKYRAKVSGERLNASETMDHVWPRSRGGRSKVVVCHKCNADKASRSLTEWWELLRQRGDWRAAFVDQFLWNRPDVLAAERREKNAYARALLVLGGAIACQPQDGSPKPWVCRTCDKRFTSKAGVDAHWKAIHAEAFVRDNQIFRRGGAFLCRVEEGVEVSP